MVNTAPEINVVEFGDNIMMLAQQKVSKLFGETMMDTSVVGDSFTEERIGKWNMTDKAGGVIATPEGDPGYSRRMAFMNTKHDARQCAREEDLRTKVSISSPWTKNAGGAIGREIDTVIITAGLGDAGSGKNGLTPVALPAGQKLATVTGETLTTDFVISVKTKFDNADIDANGRKVAINPTDLNAMLLDPDIKTIDSNTIKALVAGTFDTWMGFKWISTTQITAGTVMFFHEDAIKFGMNEAPFVKEDILVDQSYAQQIYYELDSGAVRLEEEGVVEVTITP